MAITTATTIANILKTLYEPKLSDLVFENSSIFRRGDNGGLFDVLYSSGGASYNWPVRYASTAAETFVEGQAAPAPGNNSYLMATLSYTYFRRYVEITGHALDASRGEAQILAALDSEMVGAIGQIQDAINTTFLGTANGLELAVDSSGSYAGINRSTYTGWGSWENALTGAHSLSACRDMVEGVTDNDRGANVRDLVFLMPVNQVTNHGMLAGAGAGVPVVNQGGGIIDMGFSGLSYGGIPIIGVPDMTDTIILLVHRPSCHWIIQRDLKIEEKQVAGDGVSFALTMALTLACEQPNLCAKQTGVTA